MTWPIYSYILSDTSCFRLYANAPLKLRGEAMKTTQSFGEDLELMLRVVITGRSVSADRDFWVFLANNPELFRKAVDFVRNNLIFTVVVDYSRTFEEMIAAGGYKKVHKQITSDNFPIRGRGRRKRDVFLFRFYGLTKKEGAIAKMAKEGFRPAKAEELLALGEAYPLLQTYFPIVGFGSGIKGSHKSFNVICLDVSEEGRALYLGWFKGGWPDYFVFAGVKKRERKNKSPSR